MVSRIGHSQIPQPGPISVQKNREKRGINSQVVQENLNVDLPEPKPIGDHSVKVINTGTDFEPDENNKIEKQIDDEFTEVEKEQKKLKSILDTLPEDSYAKFLYEKAMGKKPNQKELPAIQEIDSKVAKGVEFIESVIPSEILMHTKDFKSLKKVDEILKLSASYLVFLQSETPSLAVAYQFEILKKSSALFEEINSSWDKLKQKMSPKDQEDITNKLVRWKAELVTQQKNLDPAIVKLGLSAISSSISIASYLEVSVSKIIPTHILFQFSDIALDSLSVFMRMGRIAILGYELFHRDKRVKELSRWIHNYKDWKVEKQDMLERSAQENMQNSRGIFSLQPSSIKQKDSVQKQTDLGKVQISGRVFQNPSKSNLAKTKLSDALSTSSAQDFTEKYMNQFEKIIAESTFEEIKGCLKKTGFLIPPEITNKSQLQQEMNKETKVEGKRVTFKEAVIEAYTSFQLRCESLDNLIKNEIDVVQKRKLIQEKKILILKAKKEEIEPKIVAIKKKEFSTSKEKVVNELAKKGTGECSYSKIQQELVGGNLSGLLTQNQEGLLKEIIVAEKKFAIYEKIITEEGISESDEQFILQEKVDIGDVDIKKLRKREVVTSNGKKILAKISINDRELSTIYDKQRALEKITNSKKGEFANGLSQPLENVSAETYAKTWMENRTEDQQLAFYVDHQETITSSTKFALRDLITRRHSIEKIFANFKFKSTAIYFGVAVASLTAIATLTIISLLVLPIPAIGLILSAISLGSAFVSIGLIGAGLYLALKYKPIATKGDLPKLKIQTIYRQIRFSIKEWRCSKQANRMRSAADRLHALSIKERETGGFFGVVAGIKNYMDERAFRKTTAKIEKEKSIFFDSEKQLKGWEKKLRESERKSHEHNWQDLIRLEGFNDTAFKEQLGIAVLDRFIDALMECDLDIIDDELKYLLEVQMGLNLDALQKEMKDNPEAFKVKFREHFSRADAQLSQFIKGQKMLIEKGLLT